MNRRGFLKKAAGAAGAIALGSSILPKEVKAANPSPTPKIEANRDSTGGYLIPIEYADDFQRILEEQQASIMDRIAIEGTGIGKPVGLLKL